MRKVQTGWRRKLNAFEPAFPDTFDCNDSESGSICLEGVYFVARGFVVLHDIFGVGELDKEKSIQQQGYL